MGRTWAVSLGFIFFVVGLLSLILKLSGMQFIFMRIFQNLMGTYSTLLYAVLCLGGLMLVVISLDSTRPPVER